MNTLRTIIEKTLENQGIYSVLKIHPGKYKNFARNLILIWAVLNVPALLNIDRVVIILCSVFMALIVEQVVTNGRNIRNRGSFPATMISKSTLPKWIRERINWVSISLFVLFRYGLEFGMEELGFIDVDVSLIRVLEIVYTGNMVMLLPLWEAGIRVPELLEVTLIGMGRVYKRAIHTLQIAIRSSLRYSIPGFVLVSILGVISPEIWQFFRYLSWTRLAIISMFFLIPILISSQKKIEKKIEDIIFKKTDDPDIVSTGEIIKSLKKLSGADYYLLSEHEIENYQTNENWKWKENLLYRVRSGLAHDQRSQAVGVYRITIIYAAIIFFLFVLISAVFLFPREFLQEVLTPGQISYLSYAANESFTIWYLRVVDNITQLQNDVVLKYAVISTFFLIGQFIILYPENNTVFEELGVSEQMIKDWSSLMYVSLVINENGFQSVEVPIRFAGINNHYFWLRIFVIPDTVTTAHISNYIERLAKMEYSNSQDISRAKFIVTKINTLQHTEFYKSLNSFLGLRNISTEFPQGYESKAWIFLGEKVDGNTVLEFETFDEAKNWLVPKVVPQKYR